MKLQGFKKFDYKKLATILKIASDRANILICINKEVLPMLGNNIQSLIDMDATVKDGGEHLVIYVNNMPFNFRAYDSFLSLASNPEYSGHILIVELVEGFTDISEIEIYGNGPEEMLPDNLESLMIDGLAGGDKFMNNQWDKETPSDPMSDEDLQLRRDFADPKGKLPRFISNKR